MQVARGVLGALRRPPNDLNRVCCVGFAGHSKWSNIRHKKAAKDAQRSKAQGKLTVEITTALKNANGDTENMRFQAAVTRAKQSNIPKDTIEKAIQKGLSSQTKVGDPVRSVSVIH